MRAPRTHLPSHIHQQATVVDTFAEEDDLYIQSALGGWSDV
jgi:hypothetical protein